MAPCCATSATRSRRDAGMCWVQRHRRSPSQQAARKKKPEELVFLGMQETAIERDTRETDLEAIHQVVSSVQHATQNELVDEFLALFRPDAIWTTGGGKRLLGLEEIAAFTRQAL